MSALGQKQTFREIWRMSPLPRTADIHGQDRSPLCDQSNLRRRPPGAWDRKSIVATQFARRSLLIRRVTTTPSSDQSKAIVPPSWAAILRCTNLLPKPSSFVGATTGGPPRSVHITTTSFSSALHDTSKVPLESDSAPYFAELVANSWITKASAVLEVSPTFILGTETRIRTLAPFSSYGASRTEMRSPRSVASLLR